MTVYTSFRVGRGGRRHFPTDPKRTGRNRLQPVYIVHGWYALDLIQPHGFAGCNLLKVIACDCWLSLYQRSSTLEVWTHPRYTHTHPGRLAWNLKIDLWKTSFFSTTQWFSGSMMFHVNRPECSGCYVDSISWVFKTPSKVAHSLLRKDMRRSGWAGCCGGYWLLPF